MNFQNDQLREMFCIDLLLGHIENQLPLKHYIFHDQL